MDLELFYLVVCWILWCVLHSLMISQTAVSNLKERFGGLFRYYRLLYNLVSIITLIPVLIYAHSQNGNALFAWSGVWRPVQLALVLSALVLFYAGGRHYDLGQFMGIRQIMEHESRKSLSEKGGLDTSGILQVIRHPWYAAGILIIWARPLDRAALVTNTVLTAYLFIGTVLEERKLIAEFGQEYRMYQRQVPMFIPGIKSINRGS